MSDYKILFNGITKRLQLVDMHTFPDMSPFTGECISSLKGIFPPSVRRYYTLMRGVASVLNGTFIFTNGDGEMIISSPSEGGYVPPRSNEPTSRSTEIGTYLSSWKGHDRACLVKIKPFEGLLYSKDLSAFRIYTLYSCQIVKDSIPGWVFENTSETRVYMDTSVNGGGMKCNNTGESIIASAVVRKETLVGITEFAIRLISSDNVEELISEEVRFNEDLMTRDEGTDIWRWSGAEVKKDSRINITVGGTRYLTSVETYND